MIKLAFAGKKQSGKTTLAEYCADIHDLEPFSFADELKMNLVEIGIEPSRVFDKRDPTSRALMQHYGQAMRDQNEDYWLDIMLGKLANLERVQPTCEGVTIDDLRYKNEAQALVKAGFTLVKIVREGYNHEVDEHPSEAGLPDAIFDHILVAKDKDTEALFRMIDEIIEEMENANG
jgi:hypothetical protein